MTIKTIFPAGQQLLWTGALSNLSSQHVMVMREEAQHMSFGSMQGRVSRVRCHLLPMRHLWDFG